MTMNALTWRQVHAWRVAQHGLSPRFSRRDFVKAVTLTGGIQAQVMSAAELANGPATPEDFALWWGRIGKVPARKLFNSLTDELEEVDVEGWRGLVLRTTLELMQSLEAAETIHLLPLFDAYTLGMPRNIEPMLAQAYKRRVFRSQGWVTAVILINGSIWGVWLHTNQRLHIVVKVQLFTSPTGAIRKGIEVEVERLASFFKKKVLVEYEDP